MGLNLWAFAAITVPLVATPGASTAVVLRNALAGGVRSGVATALGANAGSLCYGLLTAFGVSVVLQRWPWVWIAVRVAGNAYLVARSAIVRERDYGSRRRECGGSRTSPRRAAVVEGSATSSPVTRDGI